MNQELILENAHEFEVYCYLKKHLKAPYQIISEPSKEYYSEWDYHYIVKKENRVVHEISGNFNTDAPGKLKEWAGKIIQHSME
jgi:hypothetical protein